jgi:protein ImuB
MTTRRRERLWLAVRLPTLPISAVTELQDAPQAVADKHHVVAVNRAALAAGVHPGMDVTTAQLLGSTALIRRDEQLEDAALSSLEIHLYQITPHIQRHYVHEPVAHGILLEISTCLSLFGGCGSLVEEACTILRNTPHQFVVSLGHTAAAAWLLTKVPNPPHQLTDREEIIRRLKALPIDFLDLREHRDLLQKMGFSTIGDIAAQIDCTRVDSLRKRLGHAFALYLSELFDIEGDFAQRSLFEKPVPILKPHEEFNEGIQFDFPGTAIQHLQLPMECLLQKAEERWRRRQLECQCIEWQLTAIDDRKETVTVEADKPQINWQLFYDLTMIHFEHQELPFEVDGLRLLCRRETPVENRDLSLNLPGAKKSSGADFERTAAKLRARVGDARVYKLSYRDAFLPEQSHTQIPLSQAACQALPPVHQIASRPSWLFTKPEPVDVRDGRLHWRGYLELMAGPERMAGNWWEDTQARDYYVAKRHDAVCLWVYRDLVSKQWFVHGVFT